MKKDLGMRRTTVAGLGAALMVTAVLPAYAQGYNSVSPHVRRDGTYVQPHFRTNPNSNPYDNWSTRGNTNPYTGQPGYRNPTPNYGYGAPTAPTYPSYPSYGSGSRSPRY